MYIATKITVFLSDMLKFESNSFPLSLLLRRWISIFPKHKIALIVDWALLWKTTIIIMVKRMIWKLRNSRITVLRQVILQLVAQSSLLMLTPSHWNEFEQSTALPKSKQQLLKDKWVIFLHLLHLLSQDRQRSLKWVLRDRVALLELHSPHLNGETNYVSTIFRIFTAHT